MVNAGKAWDDAYFSDTNDVRAQRLGSSNSAAMIPEFLYDFENQRVITPEYDTDWQDELYRNAPSQRHHISVNGGTDKIRYEVSAAYQNQEGIILSTGHASSAFSAKCSDSQPSLLFLPCWDYRSSLQN